MAELIPVAELSLLDQIRLAEAEITRKAMAAREDAEHRLIEARIQAARIKKQAHEDGGRAGKVQYKETVSRAEEEARIITAQAQYQANALLQKGHSRMKMAVEYTVNIILGLDTERGHDEP